MISHPFEKADFFASMTEGCFLHRPVFLSKPASSDRPRDRERREERASFPPPPPAAFLL
jgi:hypothetical protein